MLHEAWLVHCWGSIAHAKKEKKKKLPWFPKCPHLPPSTHHPSSAFCSRVLWPLSSTLLIDSLTLSFPKWHPSELISTLLFSFPRFPPLGAFGFQFFLQKQLREHAIPPTPFKQPALGFRRQNSISFWSIWSLLNIFQELSIASQNVTLLLFHSFVSQSFPFSHLKKLPFLDSLLSFGGKKIRF